MFFGVRRLSLRIMSSRFVHVVARVSPSCCFMDRLTFFGGLRACEGRGPCQESVGVQVLSDCLVHPPSPRKPSVPLGSREKAPPRQTTVWTTPAREQAGLPFCSTALQTALGAAETHWPRVPSKTPEVRHGPNELLIFISPLRVVPHVRDGVWCVSV